MIPDEMRLGEGPLSTLHCLWGLVPSGELGPAILPFFLGTSMGLSLTCVADLLGKAQRKPYMPALWLGRLLLKLWKKVR